VTQIAIYIVVLGARRLHSSASTTATFLMHLSYMPWEFFLSICLYVVALVTCVKTADDIT